MYIEVIMSTMYRENINELMIENKNIKGNLLIINQTNNKKQYKLNNIRMINYSERGLSKSRNRAIENSKADICLIADDDIIYKKDYIEIIQDLFNKNPNIDVITLRVDTPEGIPFKKYRKKSFIHNKFTIFKVSSISIAFRRNSILENNIKFDESFGLGAQFATGEEAIFLNDCISKGLRVKYEPISLVIHPFISSGKIFNENQLFAKGALMARLFGNGCYIINLIFALKKYKFYRNKYSILKAYKLLNNGSINYFKSIKVKNNKEM